MAVLRLLQPATTTIWLSISFRPTLRALHCNRSSPLLADLIAGMRQEVGKRWSMHVLKKKLFDFNDKQLSNECFAHEAIR